MEILLIEVKIMVGMFDKGFGKLVVGMVEMKIWFIKDNEWVKRLI